MTSFANLSANLRLNIQDFSSKLQSASAQMNRFAKNLNGEVVGSMKELNKQTNAWGLNMKSVSRVVSGIVISQAFYRILQSVNAATNAVWEFTKQLEYAQIAYSNLFGDTALASEFINVLKDFAAKTPFSFTEAEKAAKRLLAYGVEYKNVMYVMQGVLSAAAIQGDSAKIESISRALGQIYTYGKLMTQEVRQLSEAGIPAYEILQEELGLTQEQLRNLGNEAIPASVAINALVDGIQKRFGSVTVAASKTITGLISNIKDNATMLFAELFNPLTRFIKSALVELGEFFYAMREIVELKGAGGVFEALFPPEMHGILRQFVASFGVLGQAIIRLVHAAGGLLKPILDALIRVFNAFAPIIATVLNVLAELIRVITGNATAMKVLTAILASAAAMWVIFKIRAMAAAVVSAVIVGISKALAGLHTMLTFVAAHPFWALLIGLGGVLVGLSIGFGELSNKVSNFFKQLTGFNGIDPDKVLLPSQKDRANDLDKFNKKLDGTADAMDDLADSTGKATKAAKGLLSFDEVFKLNEPDEGTDNGIETPDLGDLDLGDLGDAYMPEVPDFNDYMKQLTGGFLEKLKEAWNNIKDKIAGIVSTAIGAAFGGLIGRLLGGKLGGVLGTIAGAIVGYFWNKLADYFNLTPDQKVNAGIIGGVGAIIGAILGGIIGGPLGAKIGAAVGGIVGSFWGIFAEALGVVPEQHIATAISGALSGAVMAGVHLFTSLVKNLIPVYIDDVFAGFARNASFSIKGALVGALKQGVLGAVVGLGTGILSNALTGWIAKELELTEKDLENAATGQTIGSIIGTITGLILGGPMGSLVGGALGQLGGSIIAEFWAYMNSILKGSIIGGAAGLPVGALVGTLVGSIGGPLGAGLGAAIGLALGGLVGLIVEYWEPIKDFFVEVGKAISKVIDPLIITFGLAGAAVRALVDNDFALLKDIAGVIVNAFNVVKEAVANVATFIADSLGFVITFIKDIFSGIATFFSDIASAISTLWSDISLAVNTVLSDLWSAITTVWGDIFTAIDTVLSDIWLAITTVWNDVLSAVTTVCTAVFGIMSEIWYLIRDLVVKVFTDVWNALVTWFTPIATEISRICSSIWNTITTIFTSIFNTIKSVLSSIFTVVSQVFTNIFNTIKTVVTNIFNTVKSVFTNIFNTIKTVVTNIFSTVKTIFTNMFNSVKMTVTNIFSTVKTIFTNIYNSVKTTVANIYTSITGKFTDAYTSVKNTVSSLYNSVTGFFSNMYSSATGSVSDMYTSIKEGIGNIYNTFTNWISNMWDNVFDKFFGWISDGISKLREFFGLEAEASNVDVSRHGGGSKSFSGGHATGGIFDREHVARFAEGNKAEAIIPLENDTAMQPFVDAVANGLTASLAPILSNMNFSSNQAQQLQPLYVGTLIADERSLKELERRMEVIRLQESRR